MTHIHERIDFTVEAFIVFGGKVLLRKHDKYKRWLSIGGHIELDEDPVQAIIREVKEEVGLDVELFGSNDIPPFRSQIYKELLPPVSMNRHRINERHEHVTLVYYARSKTDKLRLSDTEVTEACKWFSRKELDDPSFGIDESIRYSAIRALETIVENV
jgi:8-oxo-dGTP pyrophosphatase MutT (NUDIX family)